MHQLNQVCHTQTSSLIDDNFHFLALQLYFIIYACVVFIINQRIDVCYHFFVL